jgi:hypothetical protein
MSLDKASFVSIIEAMYMQSILDQKYSERVSDLFKSESIVPTYDNSSLFNVLFELLQKQFVPDGGCCEIERYCFELNYGFTSEGVRVITAEMLWEQLNGLKDNVLVCHHQEERETSKKLQETS